MDKRVEKNVTWQRSAVHVGAGMNDHGAREVSHFADPPASSALSAQLQRAFLRWAQDGCMSVEAAFARWSTKSPLIQRTNGRGAASRSWHSSRLTCAPPCAQDQ